MSETAIVKSCLDRLKLRKIPAWRNNTGAFSATHKGKNRYVRYGEPGSSDIIGVVPPDGRMLCVECKTPLGPRGGGSKQSMLQACFQEMVEDAGGLYVLVRSVDELDEWLKQIGVW